ncbi:MAG: NAD(P)H-hydrate dehydratase [Clostridia bacterium]|nr:NAD(P)H-hydrate dehydratase [Clostridia bacterium]
MYPLLTVAQMRQCDEYTINHLGIPSQELMERAARAAIEVLYSEPDLGMTDKTCITVLCGCGNNGGDGFAMARFLFEEGVDVLVCYAGEWENGSPNTEKMSVECARQYTFWCECGGRTQDDLPAFFLEYRPKSTIVVDALFGIGLCREITGLAANWIKQVTNYAISHNTPVLAIDTPSGVHADSGRILGLALRATVTATMGEVKRGLILQPTADFVGKLRVCNIGVTSQALFDIPQAQRCDTWCLTEDMDITSILYRPPHAHKGTFGRVVVMGGCYGMSGAPYFAAKSAYRAGAGLVEIFTDEANRIPLQTLLPEAVLTLFSAEPFPSDEQLISLFDRADSVVIGCGLGQSNTAYHIVEATLRLCRKPLVLDADALNLVAAHDPLQTLMAARNAPTVITPHMAEASRLSGRTIAELAADPFASSATLAQQYHAVCVLKDARTVISDGKIRLTQTHGNSGMATGGSGDCLAGLIGSLLAKTRNHPDAQPTFVAAQSVLIHAMAGDYAAHRLGQHAMMASDIADAIGDVLQSISNIYPGHHPKRPCDF